MIFSSTFCKYLLLFIVSFVIASDKKDVESLSTNDLRAAIQTLTEDVQILRKTVEQRRSRYSQLLQNINEQSHTSNEHCAETDAQCFRQMLARYKENPSLLQKHPARDLILDALIEKWIELKRFDD